MAYSEVYSSDHADATQTRAPILIVVVAVLLTLASIMVALRVLCRLRIKEFGLDDFMSVIALSCILGCGATMVAMTHYGLGKHEWTVAPETLILYGRAFWLSILFYMLSLIFLKLTFLFQYYRIMSVSNLRWLFLTAIIIVALWGTSQAIMPFIQCIPLKGVWDPRVKAKCTPNTLTLWFFNGVFNIVTDIVILILPLPIIWKLELPRSQKFILIGIFCLGFFTVAVSILRLQWLTPQPDVTWWNVTAACWSLAELTTAITCACVPTFRPLISGMQRLFKGSTKGDSVVRLQMENAESIEADTESNTSGVRRYESRY